MITSFHPNPATSDSLTGCGVRDRDALDATGRGDNEVEIHSFRVAVRRAAVRRFLPGDR